MICKLYLRKVVFKDREGWKKEALSPGTEVRDIWEPPNIDATNQT